MGQAQTSLANATDSITPAAEAAARPTNAPLPRAPPRPRRARRRAGRPRAMDPPAAAAAPPPQTAAAAAAAVHQHHAGLNPLDLDRLFHEGDDRTWDMAEWDWDPSELVAAPHGVPTLNPCQVRTCVGARGRRAGWAGRPAAAV